MTSTLNRAGDSPGSQQTNGARRDADGSAAIPPLRDVAVPSSEVADSPTVGDLVDAHRARKDYRATRQSFEREHGSIVEAHFVRNFHGGAVLVREPGLVGRARGRRSALRIESTYDSGDVDLRIDELLREVATEQRQSTVVLGGTAQRIAAQTAFSLLVHLLNTLDAVHGKAGDGISSRIDSTLESTRKELEKLERFQRKASQRAALLLYLLGLPLGVLACAGIVFWAAHSVSIRTVTDNALVAACLFSGAVGAIISVMARIHNGKRTEVEYDHSRAVVVLAGGFRPLIGAIFGGVLYVLVVGGLLPLAIPSPSASVQLGVDRTTLFFTGLAFLAGFSERWAQDTIVNSQPKFTLEKSKA